MVDLSSPVQGLLQSHFHFLALKNYYFVTHSIRVEIRIALSTKGFGLKDWE